MPPQKTPSRNVRKDERKATPEARSSRPPLDRHHDLPPLARTHARTAVSVRPRSFATVPMLFPLARTQVDGFHSNESLRARSSGGVKRVTQVLRDEGRQSEALIQLADENQPSVRRDPIP